MSVCTGALLLGKGGLLDGLRVTTQHEVVDALRNLAPNAIVDPSGRFHDNGRILTSAGIDCSLHLVGRLLGKAASSETAAYMEYGQGNGH